MDRSHQADRICKVGTKKPQIAVTFGDRVNDRREILGRQRIGGFVDDLKAMLLRIGFRAENGVAREFGVRGQERHSCRSGILLCGEYKEPSVGAAFGSGPVGIMAK